MIHRKQYREHVLDREERYMRVLIHNFYLQVMMNKALNVSSGPFLHKLVNQEYMIN